MVGIVPPNYNACTVEKVAINAVMAGCKPEYMPVVLAGIEAALMEDFGMHGLLATTFFVGPMLVVNGPIAREIGMNAGVNVLGQGNRANATIGRNASTGDSQRGGRGAGWGGSGNAGKSGEVHVLFCGAGRGFARGSLWPSNAGSRQGYLPCLFSRPAGVTPIMDKASRGPRGTVPFHCRLPQRR